MSRKFYFKPLTLGMFMILKKGRGGLKRRIWNIGRKIMRKHIRIRSFGKSSKRR
jgi:hypothetical protein